MNKKNLKIVYKDQNVIVKVRKEPPAWYIWVRPAVTLLPVTDKGKILIMHEYKAITKRWVWGFPGGIIEKRETAIGAAKRECEEELGFKVGRVKKITTVKTNFPDTSVTYFLGFNLKKTKAKGWEKIGKTKEVSIKELMQMALAGKVQEPRTVMAILRLYQDIERKDNFLTQ